MTEALEHPELAPLFGSAWTLGDHVSAESLLSLPTRAARMPHGFIVAGSEFGVGEPAAAAVAALQAAGIGAVICRSFYSPFEKAAIHAGLLQCCCVVGSFCGRRSAATSRNGPSGLRFASPVGDDGEVQVPRPKLERRGPPQRPRNSVASR